MAWKYVSKWMFNVKKQADSLVYSKQDMLWKDEFVAKWKVTKHNLQTNTPNVKESVIVLWINAVS